MGNNLKNWKEFATGDWKEFKKFCDRRYPSIPFKSIEGEFASKLGIKANVMSEVTDFAAGKLTEVAFGSTIGSVVSFADLMAKAGGLLWYSSANMFYGRTRKNPHFLLIQRPGSSVWEFNQNQLSDYVKFILYWYPNDRDAGYYGFRYGAESNGVAAPLRRTK